MTTVISGDTGIIFPDSSQQSKAVGLGPAVHAFRSAAFSSGTGAQVVIPCDTELFDTANAFTSGLFNPQVAGYYAVSAGVQVAEAHAVRALIIKGSQIAFHGVVGNQSSVASGIVYMNGTTDTLSLGISNSTGAFNLVVALPSVNYLTATLVRFS